MTAVPEDFKTKVRAELEQARERCLSIITGLNGEVIRQPSSDPIKINKKKKRKSKKVIIKKCWGCGCPKDDQTPGCYTCYHRHRYRDRVRGIVSPRTCKGCGCAWSGEPTKGCTQCQSRLRSRRLKRGELVPRMCKGCGCEVDQRTKGCRQCNNRHAQRRKKTT